jgi:hypothetical protein
MRRVRALTGLLAAGMLAAGTSGVLAAAPDAIAAPPGATGGGTDAGLYGAADPTYDGVYRQSLALTGLVAAGAATDPAAVDWLVRQQCADGAFTGYRADPSAPCSPASEDENATAGAVMAFAALGKPTASAVAALRRFQLADGGFYDTTAFGPAASDANSTGLALSAFAAAGIDPATVTAGGKSGADYLRSLQLPCTAATGAGGYDYQGEATLVANDYASAQAALGQLGRSLPVAPGSLAATVPTCAPTSDAATSASDALGYLAARLTATNGAIPAVTGSGTDWTTTADAVLALAAGGQGAAAVSAALAALQANVAGYAKSGGSYGAGQLGTLLLVAHATGTDPAHFGGVDLIAALRSIERNPPTLPMTGGRGVRPLAAAGFGLLVLGIALTVLAATRRRTGTA